MAFNRMLQHAAVLLLSLGSVYMATYLQWPILLRAPSLKESATNGTHNWLPTVLLISLDGLKPQYVDGNNMATLRALSNGKDLPGIDYTNRVLTADSMIPVSPSLTFPNHWTLQTGLLPSSHGIVANDFHVHSSKSMVNDSFYYTDPSRSWDPSWWHGVSIWDKLEILGTKTANLMWPGPPLTSTNIQSTYFQKYEKGWSLDNRVDKIMSWLDKEDLARPQFICAYAPDVDAVTHALGPDESIEAVSSILQKVDEFIFAILKGIDLRNASSLIDVVIVSDHGMTSTSNDRLVYLEELLGQSLFSHMVHWDGWPNVGLRFNETDDLKEATLRLQDAKGHFEVATREELLAIWGWNNSKLVEERVADLWILPEVGWSITTKDEMKSFQQNYRPRGNHGYHAKQEEMHAFFMALGPSFRSPKRQRMKPFANLQVHNLVMDLLSVPDSDRTANDGTPGFWDAYLNKT